MKIDVNKTQLVQLDVEGEDKESVLRHHEG